MKKEGKIVILMSIVIFMFVLISPYILSATFNCDWNTGQNVQVTEWSNDDCTGTVLATSNQKWCVKDSCECCTGTGHSQHKTSNANCDWTCTDKTSAPFCIGYLAYVNKTNATTCGSSYESCNYASTSTTIRAPTSDYLCACKPYSGIIINNKTTMLIDIGKSLTYYFSLNNVSKIAIRWTDSISTRKANIYLGNVWNQLNVDVGSPGTKIYSSIFKIADNLTITGLEAGKNITIYEVNISGTCLSNCSIVKSQEVSCGQIVQDGCGCPCNINGTKCNEGEFCDTSSWTCESLTQPLDKPYWTDTIGTLIDQANVNDTVFMNVPGQGIENKFINYTILKRGSFSWWPPNWFQHVIFQSSTLGISDWKVFELGTFYFKAKVDNSENESDDLEALEYDNSEPVIVWDSPFYNSSKVVNYLPSNMHINFDQSSYDIDDLLRITWDFGDGNNRVFNDYSIAGNSEARHTTYTYSIEGRYVSVTLTAQEMQRAQYASETHRFYVLREGINVIPVISSPSETANFTGNLVFFNASATHVLNCTKGMCPPNKDCSPYSDYNLYCFYEHAPLQKTVNGYDLIFNWKITTAGDSDRIDKSGNLTDNYNRVVEFWEPFASANKHTANLTVIYRK